MRILDNNIAAFFELVRAGLWEKDVELRKYGTTDFDEIKRLAEEQSVVGLVTAGLERVTDVKAPTEALLQFIGETLQIEERNKMMNAFIRVIVEKMREADIYTLLVKGQGVAQCYERPLWRTSGDVDFYLSNTNYEKAKMILIPLASELEPEDKRRLHLGMAIDSWMVELHGTMNTGISRLMNVVSDEVHQDLFYNGNVRSWNNNGALVFLPSPNNDIIIIFNHFINHFYGEGIGLRQICDWCRLLWTYRSDVNIALLEKRLKKMGLMTEWRTFGVFAVDYLGMPKEAMPLFKSASSYKKKAKIICKLILETGSFGYNKDESYRLTSTKIMIYFITLWRRFKEFARLTTIFPCNAPRFFVNYVINRARVVI